MPEGLKIQVAADVQQAISGLKAVESQAETTGKSIASSFAGAKLQGQQMAQGVETAFKSVTTEIRKTKQQVNIFEGSIETLQARIGARKSFLNTETDIAKIRQLNKEISLLEFQVASLANSGKVKFDQLGNAVSNSGKSIAGAAANINLTGLSLDSIGKGASKAVAGLLRISYLLPGIGFAGLVGGILTVGGALLGLGGNAQEVAVDFSSLDAKVKQYDESQKELTTSSNKAADSLIGQSKTLKDLRGILISTTASTDQLTAATINQGVARLIFDQKESEIQKVLSAEIERQFLLRSRMGGMKAPEFISDPELDKLKLYQKTLGKLGAGDQGLNRTIKRIEELNNTIGSSKGSLNFLNSITGDLQKFFSGFISKPEELKVKPKKIKIERPELGSVNIEIPTVFDVLGEDQRSRFKKQLDELSNKVQLVLPVTLDLSKPGKAFQNLQDKNASILAAMRKLGEDTARAFNEALQSGLTNGLAGIGEGLGNALAGGDIGDAFKAFASSIGEALQAMGKQIIGIGIAALLAKEALKTLFANPVTAILAGTALIAAGAALKSALSGGVKGFASGGLVTGPQLALIGEGAGTSRSNPEVVAPLDKLKGYIAGMGGGVQQVVVMRTQVRGNNLELIQARTSRANRRAGAR